LQRTKIYNKVNLVEGERERNLFAVIKHNKTIQKNYRKFTSRFGSIDFMVKRMADVV